MQVSLATDLKLLVASVAIYSPLIVIPKVNDRLLQTVGDLLLGPRPPLPLLIALKDFAKSSRASGALSGEIASVLYFSSILLARSRHQRSISDLSETAVREGISWVLAQGWLDPALQKVLEAAKKKEFDPPPAGKGKPKSPG
jgi:hypothetical protein